MYPSTAKEKEAVRRTVLLGELNARRLLSAPCHEGNKKCGLPTNSTAVAAATSQRHLFSIASVLTPHNPPRLVEPTRANIPRPTAALLVMIHTRNPLQPNLGSIVFRHTSHEEGTKAWAVPMQ
jgi:hypothetical protein